MTFEDTMKKISIVIMVAALAAISVSLYKSYKDLMEESVPVPEGEVTVPYADSTFQNVQEASSLALEVLPTMASTSTAKNQVWAGAFQLVWNDLAKELNKAPIEFADSKPQIVQLLNKSPFSEQDLSPRAYYTKWGLVSPALKREIEKGVYDKFHEKSRILNDFKWTRRPDTYVLYAMLKKDLEYKAKFNKLGSAPFQGSRKQVAYFGVTDKDTNSSLRSSVRVLFYNNREDFAVTLQSKQGDLIHLYRTPGNKPLDQVYAEMKRKAAPHPGGLGETDEFKAPKLDFNAKQEFSELYNHLIVPSHFVITKALEAIQFKMDETGTQLVAEAAMEMTESASIWEPPHYFHFTGPYVIFMEEPGKQPYFAARITDPAALNKR